MELAATLEILPSEPDSAALNAFLLKRKAADPVHSPDLSLAVIKLMGRASNACKRPVDPEQGHFGLGTRLHAFNRANRRFADLVTQRLVKTVIAHEPCPYSDGELADIASNCTLKEDGARKLERAMTKRIAAAALQSRVGEMFDAIVMGITPKARLSAY